MRRSHSIPRHWVVRIPQSLVFPVSCRSVVKRMDSFATDNGVFEADPAAMKHLIANAAHDLKTPLASFMAGASLIAEFLKELEGKVHSLVDNNYVASQLLDSVINIRGNLRDIINTNSFMLMTINRCLDYTKASSGLKLVPKNETCELAETLRLPLLCMQNAQEGSTLRMDPIPPNICAAIITDKQWLQENLLCLLSNAVKYSGGKDVSVAVRLIEASQQQKPNIESLTSPSLSSQSLNATPHSKGAGSQFFPDSPTKDDGVNSESKTRLPPMRPQFNKTKTAHTPKMFSDTSESIGSSVAEKRILLSIEVTDSGIGVPPELKGQLFHPFQQTQRLAGGTGLGLYSLAKRCDALQGEYGVRDRDDGQPGSVFFFAVPYRPDKIAAGVLATAIESEKLTSRSDILREERPSQMIASPPAAHAHSRRPNPHITLKPMASSGKSQGGVAVIENLAPLIIHRRDSTDQKDGEHITQHLQPLPYHNDTNKRSSFILKKSFSIGSSTGGVLDGSGGLSSCTEMIVKIISPDGHSAALVRTPRHVTMSPKVRSPESLPAIKNNEASSSSPSIAAAPVRVAADKESTSAKLPLKLLLVEDSTTMAKMTSALLKRQGHTVQVAVNGALALEIVTNEPETFDIILMDLQMPVMDGLEATRRIRLLEVAAPPQVSTERSSAVVRRRQRIIGLSANNDVDTLSAAFEAGFDAFMEKPLEMDIFQSTALELMQWM